MSFLAVKVETIARGGEMRPRPTGAASDHVQRQPACNEARAKFAGACFRIMRFVVPRFAGTRGK